MRAASTNEAVPFMRGKWYVCEPSLTEPYAHDAATAAVTAEPMDFL